MDFLGWVGDIEWGARPAPKMMFLRPPGLHESGKLGREPPSTFWEKTYHDNSRAITNLLVGEFMIDVYLLYDTMIVV